MALVEVYDPGYLPEIPIEIVVIGARYDDSWVFVKNHDRTGYELPAGHVEEGERPLDAARRELSEETGASEFKINTVGAYTVTRDDKVRAGTLYYADIYSFGHTPDPNEISEIKFFNKKPELTGFHGIQERLFEELLNFVNE